MKFTDLSEITISHPCVFCVVSHFWEIHWNPFWRYGTPVVTGTGQYDIKVVKYLRGGGGAV